MKQSGFLLILNRLESITVIDYRGIIQYETIGELIHRLKNQVHSMGIQVGTYKKMLLVMIEALENIMKHSERPADVNADDQIYTSTLLIRKTGNYYVIAASNLLNKQLVPILKKKIDHLNGLDRQGLKDFYKETITNGVFTNTGGAGLGLIEIAKISGNRIEYEFLSVNEVYARFMLQIVIEANHT